MSQTTIINETLPLNEDILSTLRGLNTKLAELVNMFGQIHIRRNELNQELESLETTLVNAELEFKSYNNEIKSILNSLEADYPRGRIDLDAGTVTFNPALKSQ